MIFLRGFGPLRGPKWALSALHIKNLNAGLRVGA